MLSDAFGEAEKAMDAERTGVSLQETGVRRFSTSRRERKVKTLIFFVGKDNSWLLICSLNSIEISYQ